MRQIASKWRTPQVFDEWKGCYGAGEWTRTTDLLITNKLLPRNRGGVFRLSMTLILGWLRHVHMPTIQACFGRCGLYPQQG